MNSSLTEDFQGPDLISWNAHSVEGYNGIIKVWRTITKLNDNKNCMLYYTKIFHQSVGSHNTWMAFTCKAQLPLVLFFSLQKHENTEPFNQCLKKKAAKHNYLLFPIDLRWNDSTQPWTTHNNTLSPHPGQYCWPCLQCLHSQQITRPCLKTALAQWKVCRHHNSQPQHTTSNKCSTSKDGESAQSSKSSFEANCDLATTINTFPSIRFWGFYVRSCTHGGGTCFFSPEFKYIKLCLEFIFIYEDDNIFHLHHPEYDPVQLRFK